MNAYIRKLNRRFYLISGLPENHRLNYIVEEFHTRRQAARYAASNGYSLVIRKRPPTQAKEAA